MPKRIRIYCKNCGKVIGEKRDNTFYILRKTYGETAYTEISVEHNAGGHIEIKCGSCKEDNYFRTTDISLGLSYCVAKKSPVDK